MKAAIIGLGVIGKLHAEALSMQGEEIVALCDVDLSAAEEAKRRFAPSARIYTDWQAMLDEAHPDAVHVCTPHHLHAQMVIGALVRGIHTLCEKPLCITKEEIDKILAAEAASSATLGVCHQNRYLPANRFTKDYLADQKVLAAHGSVVWHRTKEYYESGAWRGKWATEGGGVLINQALHTLDLCLWFCGDPEEVTCTHANLSLSDTIEVEDSLFATFFGKQPFTFFATVASAADLPVEISLRLEGGEEVSVRPTSVRTGDTLRAFPYDAAKILGKPCYGGGHALLLADFYDCIQKGRHFPIDGKEGARVIRLILAAYESKEKRIKI